MIRADNPTWNGGARDQMLVGRNGGKGMRSLLSFPLSSISADSVIHSTSLDLWTAGGAATSPVKALQLIKLAATPTEGAGNGQNSTAATSGATWVYRTAQPDPGIAWTTAGGDLENQVAGDVPGYIDTNANLPLVFGSTTAFVGTSQAAVAAGKPLDLALVSPLTDSSASDGFTRIASDDHVSSSLRPRLNVTFSGNYAPLVDPGSAPAVRRSSAASLVGTASRADSICWKFLSGPGSVVFSDETSAATGVSFSQTGNYQLGLTASNLLGETTRSLAVTVAANPEFYTDWQTLTWPGITEPGTVAPESDPDSDGIANLIEWALFLDARLPDTIHAGLVKNGVAYEYTYTRRKDAEAIFQVEWSDSLENEWKTTGIGAEIPVSQTTDTRTVKVSIPASSPRKFVRLRVSRP
jgi:hypothetical protein